LKRYRVLLPRITERSYQLRLCFEIWLRKRVSEWRARVRSRWDNAHTARRDLCGGDGAIRYPTVTRQCGENATVIRLAAYIIQNTMPSG
jgi:hypothetical protein